MNLKMKVFFVLALAMLLCTCAHASKDKRLIELSEMERRWATMEELVDLKMAGINFFDVTDMSARWLALADGDDSDPGPDKDGHFPEQPQQKKFVRSLLGELSVDNIRKTVEHMQAYTTRYYTTETGVAAATWLAGQYEAILKNEPGYDGEISVELFNNTEFPQQSVIVTMHGELGRDRGEAAPPSQNRIVILGSHLDSINFGAARPAPGADDSAVSCGTGLEVFRVLYEANFVPPQGTDVQIMHFAAEEVGLRGSSGIASLYEKQQRNVVSMLQLDMTGYVNPSEKPSISLIQDFTSGPMNTFLQKLITAYTNIEYTASKAGYAASDHASFTRAGYPAAFPFEDLFGDHSPYIHTANDLLSNLNNEHMLEFARFALGYVVEMAVAEQQ
jgi:bacterial leucyl aminopeptidase